MSRMRWVKVATAVVAVGLMTVPSVVGSLVVRATGTTSLLFSINASDPGSYSTNTPGVWRDLSSAGRNGTVYGTLTYDSPNSALVFPGGSNSLNSLGYVDMGAGFNDFGSGITIEFEAHFGAVAQGWERIFDFGNGPASDNIWVGVLDDPNLAGTLAIEIFVNNFAPLGRCISPTGELVSNTFAKWVITLDGSTCRMYKNGIEVVTRQHPSTAVVGSAPGGVTYSALPRNLERTQNYIGRSNWGTDAAFDGAIKYVRIYTGALTPDQVEQNSQTYTLTYNDTDKTSGSAPNPQTGNGLITLAGNTGSLARTGHTWAGWATSAGQSVTISGSYNLTTNSAVFPVWTPNTYTVTYDEHGGSSVPDGSFTHDGPLTFPTDPVRAGYTFDGWFMAASGGTSVSATAVASGNANVTLHAQWTANTLNITYDSQLGTTPSGGVMTTTTGATVSALPTTSRAGYTFDGWFTASSGGVEITTSTAHGQTAHFTLFAQWTANTYTITYDGNSNSDGSAPVSTSATFDASFAVSANSGALVREGFTFAGWNTAANGSGTDFAAGASVTWTIPSATTLFAKWTAVGTSTTLAPPIFVRPPTTAPPTTTPSVPTTVPPTPVLDPNGELPEQDPGSGQVIENGVDIPADTFIENGTDAVIRGDDFELRVTGVCESGCRVSTGSEGRQFITLRAPGLVDVSGEGFQPGTPVDVWIFSQPTALGRITVADDGTFSGRFALPDVGSGRHTVQVNGTSASGASRTANLGVGVETQRFALPVTGRSGDPTPWVLTFLVAGLLLTYLARRPRLAMR